jgi:capsular polysaccharide biosynthesis protein
MNQEVDIRLVLRPLRQYRYLIVALTGIAAILAAVYGLFLRTPVYSSTALITVSNPSYRVRFSEDLTPLNENDLEFTKAFQASLPIFALSDDLILVLTDQLDTSRLQQPYTPDDLRGILNVATTDDLDLLIRLRVTTTDPDESAYIANVWAEQVIERGNALYNPRTSGLTHLEALQDTYATNRAAVEQQLLTFTQDDQSRLLQAELDHQQAVYAAQLERLSTLDDALTSLAAYRDRLASLSDSQPATLEDELLLLTLSFQTVIPATTRPLRELPVPLTLQGFPVTLGRTIADVKAELDRLEASLTAQQDTLQTELPAIQDQILTLQTDLQMAELQRQQLETELDLATSAYDSISQELTGTQIANQLNEGIIKLASPAAPSQIPASHPWWFLMLISGIATTFVVSAAVLLLPMFQETPTPQGKP